MQSTVEVAEVQVLVLHQRMMVVLAARLCMEEQAEVGAAEAMEEQAVLGQVIHQVAVAQGLLVAPMEPMVLAVILAVVMAAVEQAATVRAGTEERQEAAEVAAALEIAVPIMEQAESGLEAR